MIFLNLLFSYKVIFSHLKLPFDVNLLSLVYTFSRLLLLKSL